MLLRNVTVSEGRPVGLARHGVAEGVSVAGPPAPHVVTKVSGEDEQATAPAHVRMNSHRTVV